METPAGTAADPLVGRLLDQRYRLDVALARGGMATVYTATDTRLDRTVAVKVMHRALADDPEFVERFTREARAAARLHLPEVVAVFDQGTDPATGLAFLVMEHVSGGTLRDLLRRSGPQTPAQALALVEPVARALAAAHASGLVHRDVKPENVLLADDGRVKVADFGLARAVEASSLTATTGLMLGTAAYMSPEQADTGRTDLRSDVYAVGVVLWELLTGTPPYGGDSSVRVAYRHVHEDVPPPSTVVAGVPPALDALVVQATRRDPAERPADARELLAALQQVRTALPVVPPQTVHPTLVAPLPDLPEDRPTDAQAHASAHPSAEPPADPPAARSGTAAAAARRRRPLLVAAVAVAAVLALVGGWWLGARSTPVPAVLGLSAEAAESRLVAAGFEVETERGFSETVRAGLVADQAPDPREDARSGSTVTLVVSRGPDRRVLPDLRGSTQEEATETVTRLGLRVGTVTRAFSSAPVGTVVGVGAPAGTRLRPGSPVNLTVSKGVELLDVPSTVGRPQAEAGRTLERAGFRTRVEKVFSESVRAGVVVAQDPPGGRLQRDGRVTLQVSKGPERIAVPDLSGLTDAEAKARLADAGLQGRGVTPPLFGGDRVSRQNPSPGTRVKRGSTVSYLLT